MTDSPIHLLPRHRRARRAFTLIEILVVMSIILILISLLIAGSRAWTNSASRNLTLTRLQVLNSMLAELQTAGQNQYSAQWFIPPEGAFPSQYAIALDAQQIACATTDAQCALTAQGTPVGPQNYNVTATNAATNIPKVPQSFTGKYYNSRATAVAYMIYAPPSSGSNLPAVVSSTTSPKLFPSMAGPMYLMVASPNNAKMLAALGPNATISTGGGPPLVIDGWGNPILFCPGSITIPGVDLGNGLSKAAGGLTNVCLNVQPASPQTSPPTYTATVTTITSPDGRPFFASAGPDGDFAKGDDNLYSFEQK